MSGLFELRLDVLLVAHVSGVLFWWVHLDGACVWLLPWATLLRLGRDVRQGLHLVLEGAAAAAVDTAAVHRHVSGRVGAAVRCDERLGVVFIAAQYAIDLALDLVRFAQGLAGDRRRHFDLSRFFLLLLFLSGRWKRQRAFGGRPLDITFLLRRHIHVNIE